MIEQGNAESPDGALWCRGGLGAEAYQGGRAAASASCHWGGCHTPRPAACCSHQALHLQVGNLSESDCIVADMSACTRRPGSYKGYCSKSTLKGMNMCVFQTVTFNSCLQPRYGRDPTSPSSVCCTHWCCGSSACRLVLRTSVVLIYNNKIACQLAHPPLHRPKQQSVWLKRPQSSC